MRNAVEKLRKVCYISTILENACHIESVTERASYILLRIFFLCYVTKLEYEGENNQIK